MISVIIPIYNIEHRKSIFQNAIRSILSQSYNNIEVILVDDGSTDSSLALLERIQSRDKRIKIITKSNGGVESARREGLRHVSGDYILHMDQDDLYVKDAFKLFFDVAEQTGADCVIGNSSRFIFNRFIRFGEKETSSMISDQVIDHEQFMNNYYHSFFGVNDLPVNIWNKLYRRSFIEKIEEPPLTNCILEDLSYNMHILPFASKIAIRKDVSYLYRWGGWTNHYDRTILRTALTGYSLKKDLIKKYSLDDSFQRTTAIELLNYINTYFNNIVYYEKYSKDQFIDAANSVFNITSVQEASEIVSLGISRFPHIKVIIDKDASLLYDIILSNLHKNTARNLIKKIALSLT